MKISTFFYSLRQGLKNIRRNKLFSLASVSTIAACVFLLGLFYSIVMNFQHMVTEAEDAVSITVFFDEGISEENIKAIGDKIQKRAEVSSITFTSAEDAWKEFVNGPYFGGDAELAEGFKDDNPLINSSSYEIKLNDISMQKNLVSYLEATDGIRKVNYSDSTATVLTDFGKLVGYVSAVIILVLLAVSIFLISNTIMIGIEVRKEEISIMKLIGATDFFVRAPFIVEGILIGVVGAGIPLIALYYIYQKVVVYILGQFTSLTTFMTFIPTKTIFATMIPLALGIGAGIGLAGSLITLRKRLKV